MIYAVIDTNVLVSAQISKQPKSATVKVVSSMFDGHIKPVYNDEILAEYTEVIHRPKFHLSDDDVSFMLDYIRHYGIHSDRIPYTGNLKHFPATPKVISPADMVAIIEHDILEP